MKDYANKILATLRRNQEPVPTNALLREVGGTSVGAWSTLRRLRKGGLISRELRKTPYKGRRSYQYVAYWSACPQEAGPETREDDRVVTLSEAGRLLGAYIGRLHNWHKSGQLHPVYRGKAYKFRLGDIRALVERFEVMVESGAVTPKKRQWSKSRAVPCLHCKRESNIDRRGLCKTCYRTPAICDLYPRLYRSEDRGYRQKGQHQPLPAQPCPYPPGSPERIATLEARAKAEVQLWHPEDAGAVDLELGLPDSCYGSSSERLAHTIMAGWSSMGAGKRMRA